jgi:integrase
VDQGEAGEAGTWKAGRTVTNNLTREVALLFRAAGVPDASLHDLRRACITHWARKLPAAIVQELAGHADIKTTLKYYVALCQEDLAAARDVTAEALAVKTAPST